MVPFVPGKGYFTAIRGWVTSFNSVASQWILGRDLRKGNSFGVLFLFRPEVYACDEGLVLGWRRGVFRVSGARSTLLLLLPLQQLPSRKPCANVLLSDRPCLSVIRSFFRVIDIWASRPNRMFRMSSSLKYGLTLGLAWPAHRLPLWLWCRTSCHQIVVRFGICIKMSKTHQLEEIYIIHRYSRRSSWCRCRVNNEPIPQYYFYLFDWRGWWWKVKHCRYTFPRICLV